MASLISLPKILDERGNLSFFENANQIPVQIKRVYWFYDMPVVRQLTKKDIQVEFNLFKNKTEFYNRAFLKIAGDF